GRAGGVDAGQSHGPSLQVADVDVGVAVGRRAHDVGGRGRERGPAPVGADDFTAIGADDGAGRGRAQRDGGAGSQVAQVGRTPGPLRWRDDVRGARVEHNVPAVGADDLRIRFEGVVAAGAGLPGEIDADHRGHAGDRIPDVDLFDVVGVDGHQVGGAALEGDV